MECPSLTYSLFLGSPRLRLTLVDIVLVWARCSKIKSLVATPREGSHPRVEIEFLHMPRKRFNRSLWTLPPSTCLAWLAFYQESCGFNYCLSQNSKLSLRWQKWVGFTPLSKISRSSPIDSFNKDTHSAFYRGIHKSINKRGIWWPVCMQLSSSGHSLTDFDSL